MTACGGGGGSTSSSGSESTSNVSSAPTIISINPADDGTPIGSIADKRPVFSVTFSKKVKNVNTTSVVLTEKGRTYFIPITISGSGQVYKIRPNANLKVDTYYRLEFNSGITDTVGNALVTVRKLYNTPDWIIPTMSVAVADDYTKVINDPTDISVNSGFRLGFDKIVTGVTTDNVLLSKSKDGSHPISLTLSYFNGKIFRPNVKLDDATQYFIIIKAANIKDTAGNQVDSANQVISFTTYKQKVGFDAWVGSDNTLLDINDNLPKTKEVNELYSYTNNNRQTLLLNGQTITNTAHTLTRNALYKLKVGRLTSTKSSENTASFSVRYKHQAVWFKNKLWIISGGGRSDVWSSSDGVNWKQETASAGFSARVYHQVVVANIDGTEKLWLIGGYDGSYKNDVWSSEDGVTWTQSSINGAHFSARSTHQVVVANVDGTKKLWLIGGYDGSRFYRDVWSSSDGSNWSQISISGTHFSARSAHQVVVTNLGGTTEKLWLIGGRGDKVSYNDVWSSSDGRSWSQSSTSGTHFSARSAHQAVAANIDGTKKLWVIGGNDGSYKNDVWSSSDGISWNQSTINGSHFSAREYHQVVVANMGGTERLYVFGGNDSNGRKNDVWRSEDGKSWRKAYLGEITMP